MSTIASISRARRCGLTALWLAACQTHALTANLGRPDPVTGPGVDSPAAGPGAAARDAAELRGAREGELGKPGCTEQNARENCHDRTVLVGYPVEQAEQRARAAGFVGDFEVHVLPEYDASCKDGTVCRVDPPRWEIEPDITLTLLVNRKVAITTPE